MQANTYQTLNPEDKILKKLNRKINRRVRLLNILILGLQKFDACIYGDIEGRWYVKRVRIKGGKCYLLMAEKTS